MSQREGFFDDDMNILARACSRRLIDSVPRLDGGHMANGEGAVKKVGLSEPRV